MPALRLASIVTVELRYVALSDLVEVTLTLSGHLNLVFGDQAAARISNPVVRSELVYQRPQASKRDASRPLGVRLTPWRRCASSSRLATTCTAPSAPYPRASLPKFRKSPRSPAPSSPKPRRASEPGLETRGRRALVQIAHPGKPAYNGPSSYRECVGQSVPMVCHVEVASRPAPRSPSQRSSSSGNRPSRSSHGPSGTRARVSRCSRNAVCHGTRGRRSPTPPR